jgi:hypothetical protein
LVDENRYYTAHIFHGSFSNFPSTNDNLTRSSIANLLPWFEKESMTIQVT